MRKQIKDLEKGDKIESGSGEVVSVTSVSKGFYTGSKIVELSNRDWFCESNKSTIEVI